MDAALRKFLDMQTITAEDNLRSGIFDAPEGGWDLEDLADIDELTGNGKK
jgi:hypothetical protein